MNTLSLRSVPDTLLDVERSSIRIRAIRPVDASELRRFYAGLSPESRRTRFLYECDGLSQAQSVSACAADHDHRQGFVAVLDRGLSRQERIVGHLCIEPDRTNAAEVAVAVADAFQRCGIGRRLLATGAAWANGEGIDRFTATGFAGNAAIHRLLVGLGRPTRQSSVGGGVTEIVIDLARQSRHRSAPAFSYPESTGRWMP
jgi:GNAT superfamily N-acetyltransferase